jgi:hypothetical protein
MAFDEPIPTKRSIGFLRKAAIKTKDRSPDYIGALKLQRHTLEVLAQQFQENGANEIECCLASWRNIDANGDASVEISPKYVARHPRQEPTDKTNLADFI